MLKKIVLLISLTFLPSACMAQDVTMTKKPFGGWKNCIWLSNGQVELVATTDIGPRIVRFGYVDGQNFLCELKSQMGLTGGDEWRNYGGHRLWHAPEMMPRTYDPDNTPIDYQWKNGKLTLTQPVEPTTGIVKQMEITLHPRSHQVTIIHRLTNTNLWPIKLAPWCLTVMALDGRAIIPQEPFHDEPEYLLPSRTLVLWPYTDMQDPRFIWGSRYLQIKQDPRAPSKQKIGALNTLGWTAYCLNDEVFIKRYPYDPKAQYVDLGCNIEIFTNPDILEIESLGPLTELDHQQTVTHTEDWFLFKANIPETEDAITRKLLPLVKKTDRP